jgi:hypothetical protein
MGEDAQMSEELVGTPEEILEKLEKAEELFEKLEKIEMPDGVKDHAKEKWALKLEALAINRAESEYDEDEQAYDNTRVMSYDAALILLGELEDSIVWANVASPLGVAGDAILAEIENAQKILEGFYQLAKEIFTMLQKGFSWAEIWKILWGSLTRFIVVWTANTMKASTEMNLALVKTFIVKARAKAFPQADATRHLRRKRSRFRLEAQTVPTPKPKRTWYGKKKKQKAETVEPKPKEKRGPKPRVPRDDKPKP